jgi:hypothetical protein
MLRDIPQKLIFSPFFLQVILKNLHIYKINDIFNF